MLLTAPGSVGHQAAGFSAQTFRTGPTVSGVAVVLRSHRAPGLQLAGEMKSHQMRSLYCGRGDIQVGECCDRGRSGRESVREEASESDSWKAPWRRWHSSRALEESGFGGSNNKVG